MTLPKQVQELIDASGNTFHAKVAQWFLGQGWRIAVSPYYMDQSQQKARELDLVAERARPIYSRHGRQSGEILVRLYIECKYVPGPSVFWFTAKNRPAAVDLVCGISPFQRDNLYTERHHYIAGHDRVAKLFASANSKGQEAEPFYKALNQVLNAFVSLRGRIAAMDPPRRNPGQRILLEYPVVICSSFNQLYAADFLGAEATELIRSNFQLEVQYAYLDRAGSQRDDYFLIDFVDYEKLQAFQAEIEGDVNAAVPLSASG
jgi:hypothetical protein